MPNNTTEIAAEDRNPVKMARMALPLFPGPPRTA